MTEESLTVFSFSTPFGLVRLLCIGEWSVQSFVALGKIGDQVAKMDELGHFDLGSQVILSLPDGLDVCLEGSPKLFPGDPIAVVRSHSEKKAVPTLGRGRTEQCRASKSQTDLPSAILASVTKLTHKAKLTLARWALASLPIRRGIRLDCLQADAVLDIRRPKLQARSGRGAKAQIGV